MFSCHYFDLAHTTECLSGDMEYVIMWPLHAEAFKILSYSTVVGHEHMITLTVRWPEEEEEEEYFYTEQEVRDRIDFFKTLHYSSQPRWYCELSCGTILRSAKEL